METARVMSTFLTWLSEKQEPVFVLATANNITQLPPELLRKGRLDEIFFVDLPNIEERQQVLDIHLRKRGRDPGTFDLATLAEAADGFSGAELEEAGKRVFSQHREKMRRMAYANWQTMMHESVVRASVVRYLQATKGPQEARKEIKRQIEKGFLWTQELSDLLAQYEESRDQYPTLDSFFTRIVDFFEVYSRKPENESSSTRPVRKPGDPSRSKTHPDGPTARKYSGQTMWIPFRCPQEKITLLR